MTSDLYTQIMNDRGSRDRLFTWIPGWEGYADRSARRAADRLLREHVSKRIMERIDRLARIETTLLEREGGMNYMNKTRSAKTKLQTYHDRVKTAAPGYSGFFEAVKIDSDDLDRLYGFDELQMVYVDKLAGALDTLETAARSGEGINEAIDALDALAVEANEAFSRRDTAVLNLQITK